MNLNWRTYGPKGLLIRAAEPTDGEGIWAVMDQPAAQAGTLQLPFRTKAKRSKMLSAESDDSLNHFLVATLEGGIVGNGGLHLERGPRRRHTGAVGMSVHDDFHGKGIGSALMAALLELADNWLNLHRVQLEVYTDNAAGIALYRKFGFETEGTLRDYAFRDGGYVDAHIMSRLRSR